MATEVKLPDLGEGVEDATISRWRVKVGDAVSKGDIILEVATDKVDTEVPAPADGTVLKINAGEGALVDAATVLAVIGAEGEEPADDDGQTESSAPEGEPSAEPEDAEPEDAEPEDAEPEDDDEAPAVTAVEAPATPSENGNSAKASPVARRVAADKGVDLDSVSGTGRGGRITKGDVLTSAGGKGLTPLPGDLADTVSPVVARFAAENNIDLADVAQGRPLSSLTRYDVLSALAARSGQEAQVEPRFLVPRAGRAKAAPRQEAPAKQEEAAETKPASSKPASSKPASSKPAPAKQEAAASPAQPGEGDVLVKHTRMRTAIARTVVQSLYTAPHVTTMWDVNMSAVLAHRQAHKDEFAASGVNLTITAYFVEAILAGLKAVPAANASYSDEGVVIHRAYNIGMAVALPQDEYGLGGLIVPVIKNAGDLNLMGMARAVNDLADKARKNQLKADDLADGTFSLSNYGTSGSRFQTPIIVQPQVGILGVGAIEKRAVVVSQGHPLEANTGDYLAFLPMTTLGFSYDHRVLDGATADAFCAAVKKKLESY